MRLVSLVLVLCTLAAIVTAVSKEEKIREEYEKKLSEQDKKIAEQEVKHERSLKAASEIEDRDRGGACFARVAARSEPQTICASSRSW